MPSGNHKIVSNWGRYPTIEARVKEAFNTGDVQDYCRSHNRFITRGLGRCYGDSSLSKQILSTPEGLNCFISFDHENGVIKTEAGVCLAEVLKVIVPEGWFLPVVPGTCFVTLGGAVAADVHGKNHHLEGSFGDYVTELEMITAEGNLVICSQNENQQLFDATCGGMGLTGVILTVTLKLKKIESAFIQQNNYATSNLEEAFRLFEEHKNTTYSVAWIDCLARGKNLGRSILMNGEHAKVDQLTSPKQQKNPLKLPEKSSPSIPFFFPQWVLNRYSVQVFNYLYYAKNRSLQNRIMPYDSYFFPLDNIRNWNKMYGKKGFLQYQFVLPVSKSFDGMTAVLQEVSKVGMGSFLAVLKLMGPSKRLLSFPMEGYTLALDFPVNDRVLALLNKLDKIVEKHNGRCYLAKDARMKPDFFKKGYPELEKFNKVRSGTREKFVSLQSERLGI